MTPHEDAQALRRAIDDHEVNIDELDRLHRQLGDRIQAATTTLADLAGAADDLVAALTTPASPPLVTGPPWPATAQFRGAAPVHIKDGVSTVALRPATQPGASSDGHDVHIPLPAPLRSYTWQVDVLLDWAMLDALTFKVGGMAAFDGDWNAWPGGSTSKTVSAANAMERLVGQNTIGGRHPDTARWGVYATFPRPVATVPAGKDGVTAPVGGSTAWVTNGGHTCHWGLPQPARADQWTHHRRHVDYDEGTLRHWIDGHLAVELAGLPWPTTAGANRVYISCMIGGSGPEFLPRTPQRTGVLQFRRFELTP
jgi:hypothetical protein